MVHYRPFVHTACAPQHSTLALVLHMGNGKCNLKTPNQVIRCMGAARVLLLCLLVSAQHKQEQAGQLRLSQARTSSSLSS